MNTRFKRRIIRLDELAGLAASLGIAGARDAAIGAEIAWRGVPDRRCPHRRCRIVTVYHPRVPAPPLKGPTMREVIQPP